MKSFIASFAAIGLTLSVPIAAQTIDFGDDASQFARDGECDDSRFEGSGMTDTLLLESDIGHDATDCRVAFEQDRLRLKGPSPQDPALGIDVPIASIDFGSDTGEYADDSECDDVRFVGEGMAASLLTDMIGRDASDCRAAFISGSVKLNALFADPTEENPINYGVNLAAFTDDNECDDIRFTGDYASGLVYLAEDVGRDANDCRAAMESGAAQWQGKTATPNYGKNTDVIESEEAQTDT